MEKRGLSVPITACWILLSFTVLQLSLVNGSTDWWRDVSQQLEEGAVSDSKLQRLARQALPNNNALSHRPNFFLSNQSTPQIYSTLGLVQDLVVADYSFGLHQVALLNPPESIQDLEAALQAAWWRSNVGASPALGPNSIAARIVSFRDYGLFTDRGLPVVDVVYLIGLNDSNAAVAFQRGSLTLRPPTIQSLTNELLAKSLRIFDGEVVEGRILNFNGIISFAQNITAYHDGLLSAWLATLPDLNAPTSLVDIQFARTVITIAASGARLSTVPYVLMLNGLVWPGNSQLAANGSPAVVGPSVEVMENALNAQGLDVTLYRGSDIPIYAALSFVNYLSANIQYQDMPAVQRSVQSYVSASIPRPALQARVWNLEPFLDPRANIITQSSHFLSLPNGDVLDPRLFYAPLIINVLLNQTEGNVSTVTGETLGIHPVYLNGHIQASQLRSIAEILKITYAELNPSLRNDDVQVAVVSLDDGITVLPTANGGSGQNILPVTEVHVSALVNGVDPDKLPDLTPFHQMLSSEESQNALDSRLSAFSTAICRNCRFRKLRTLNLLQVDPTTSSIPDAQAVLDRILAAWIAANPISTWLPLDVSLFARDDSLANSNGTLVSQLMYSVGYPQPSFNWYIPRDPDNATMRNQLATIRAVPFFGTPLTPQLIVLNQQMSASDQQFLATAAMRAWSQDKADLRQCQAPNANCFVALVDAENPTVTTVNGAAQYQYKYYILVNDQVYVPTSPLSPPQQTRLRNALLTNVPSNANANLAEASTIPTVIVVPIQVIAASTRAPSRQASTTIARRNNALIVVPVVPSAVAVAPTSGQFNLTDSINMAVTTERQRTRVLDQISAIWQQALAPNVTDIRISTLRDVPGFPNPETADGRPIRFVTYRLQGTGNAPVDLNVALRRFRQALSSANIAPIVAANPDINAVAASATMAPYVVIFGTTPLNGSAPATGVLVVAETSSRVPTVLATAPTSRDNVADAALLLPLVLAPFFVGPGPVVINDTIILLADTRRARDRVMEEQVKPAWQAALGNNMSNLQLSTSLDSAFSTAQTPEGANIRQIQYQIQGVTRQPLDVVAARQLFYNNMASNKPRSVWAITAPNGTIVLLSDISPGTTLPVAAVVSNVAVPVALSTTTPAAAVLVVPLPPVTSVLTPRYTGSLLLRNFSPSDSDAIIQTLQQLWIQALGADERNVNVQFLSADASNITSAAEGNPFVDFRYVLLLNGNIANPEQVWAQFLALLRQSDMMDFIAQLPGQAPQAQATSSSPAVLVIPSLPVVPVLSFTERQDVTLADPGDIWTVTDQLRTLWANASGINASGAEVRVISLTPLDPSRSSATNGLPIQTLTYGVTLQNVTDLAAVRQRAEALVPFSPLAQYMVSAEQVGTVTPAPSLVATTNASAVAIVVVPAGVRSTTSRPSSSSKAGLLLIPVDSATTTTSSVLLVPLVTAQSTGVLHEINAAVSSPQDVALVASDLKDVWAQAYNVPSNNINLTVVNVRPLNVADNENRPVSNIQYLVQATDHSETPFVLSNFDTLLNGSSLAPLLFIPIALLATNATNNVAVAPLATDNVNRFPHTLRIAVADAADMDQLTNGIRNSWISTLGMEAQPQLVGITLTNVQPENIATQNGRQVSRLYYNLTVPSNIQVTANEEQTFQQTLLRSPAAQFLFVERGTTALPVLLLVPAVPTPFTVDDSVVIAATSHGQRDRLLEQVRRAWEASLAPNASNIQQRLQNDVGYSTSTTPEGIPIRALSYKVSGINNNGPLDDYAAKARFRQYMTDHPLNGIFLIPEQPAQATVAPSLTEAPVQNASQAIVVLLTTPPPAIATTSETAAVVVVPVVVLAETTTQVPTVAYIGFLHLQRPVGPLDDARLRELIAAAWSQQNAGANLDSNSVHIVSVQPVVDEKGVLGSNVSYEVRGPAQLSEPNSTISHDVLTQGGYPVCRDCFNIPVYRLLLTTDVNAISPANGGDPLAIREAVRQAVSAANPDLPANMIQAGFPQGTPPVLSINITRPQGQPLMQVDYFAAAVNNDGRLLQVAQPTVNQLQSQFGQQSVLLPGSPDVVYPVHLMLEQKDLDWLQPNSIASTLDNSTIQAAQAAVSSAMQDTVANYSLQCPADGCRAQLAYARPLYGRFGRQYVQLVFLPINLQETNGNYPSMAVIDAIVQDARSRLLSSNGAVALQPVELSNVSSPAVLNGGMAASAMMDQTLAPTDPSRVLYQDFVGRLNIFDVQGRKSQMAAAWLQANPNCLQVSCNYTVEVLATQRRKAINDGSDITRIYYTIRSQSPYVVYPSNLAISAESATLPASRAIQQVSILPGVTTNAAIQQQLLRSPRIVSSSSSSASAVAGLRRRQVEALPTDISLVDQNTRYCYHPDDGSYSQYEEASVVMTGDSNQLPGAPLNPAGNCANCICNIPVFVALLKSGQMMVNVSNGQMGQMLLQPWLERYGNVTQDVTGIPTSAWTVYILQPPNHRFHDVNGNLSLVRYGVQVAGAPPSQLLIPDLSQQEVANYSTVMATPPGVEGYQVCGSECQPLLDQSLYFADNNGLNLEDNNNNKNNNNTFNWNTLAPALAAAWLTANPQLRNDQLTVHNNLTHSTGYTVLNNDLNDTRSGAERNVQGNKVALPMVYAADNNNNNIQRLDYVVSLLPDVKWAELDALRTPSLDVLQSALRSNLNNPNLTVYPANTVRPQPQRLLQRTDMATATPHWLPAAIIVPLAGLIALTLILVCLITRASRLFRSKKTVVITDPSMIPVAIGEASFKEGNGKQNLAFDDYHNGRQDISKV